MQDQQPTKRRIVSIVAADVVGYSRLMGEDDTGTLSALKTAREVFEQLVSEQGGREFGSVGDSLMAEFPSALDATEAALAIQERFAQDNMNVPKDQRMLLRIGIYMGDILEEEGNLYGDAVNIAARLQTLASPGGICLSGAVHEQISGKFPHGFEFLGPQRVKNISQPIKAYAMTPGRSSWFTSVVSELRQRRVFRSALAYLVISWLALQVIATVLPAYDLPSWTLRAVITILVVGFAPAMFLAWIFDVTPRGLQRASIPSQLRRKRLLGFVIATTVTLGTVGTIWWIWSGYSQLDPNRVSRGSVARNPPVVAVGSFRNAAGDENLDWLGDGLANLVRNDLTRSRHLIVASHHRWNTIVGSLDREQVNSAALSAGIRFVVSGQYINTPEGLLLTTQVSDLEAGSDLAPETFRNLTGENFFSTAREISVGAKQALRVPREDTISVYSADFPTDNLAAYEAYVASISYILNHQHHQAVESLRTAIDLEPKFWAAHGRLAEALNWMGDTESAVEILESIPDDANISPRLKKYIAASLALRQQDTEKAVAIYEDILRENPSEVEAKQGLAEAYYLQYEEEKALDQLRDLALQEPENWHVWSTIGDISTQINEFESAEKSLTRCLDLQKDQPYCLYYMGNLETLRGSLSKAEVLFQRAAKANPNFHWAQLGLSTVYAVTDRSHEAIAILRDLIANESVPAQDRIDAAFKLSNLSRALGHFAESIEPMIVSSDLIAREQVRLSLSLANQALAYYEMGETSKAHTKIDEAVDAFNYGPPTRYLFIKGMMALRSDDLQTVKTIADRIRDDSLPPEDPDRTEDKAAAYLTGLVALQESDLENALVHLRSAVELKGFRYALYRIGLARALHLSGDTTSAVTMLEFAMNDRDPGDMRLDLELDRVRAILESARIQKELGNTTQAVSHANRFLELWTGSNPSHPDRLAAESIVVSGN